MSAFQLADVDEKRAKGPADGQPPIDTIETKPGEVSAAPTTSWMSKIGSCFSAIGSAISAVFSYILCCCCCKMDDKKVKVQIATIGGALDAATFDAATFKKEMDALPRQARKELEDIARTFVLLSEGSEEAITANEISSAKAEDLAKIKAPADIDAKIANIFAKPSSDLRVVLERYTEVLDARIPVEPKAIA